VASRYTTEEGKATQAKALSPRLKAPARAPDSGGGALCMPLCFWATQTAVIAADLPTGAGRPQFTPYLPPHKAATVIQHVYHSCLCDRPYRQQVAKSAFSHEMYVLERNMALAMRDLKDSDDLVYTVSNTTGSSAGFVRWPQVIWTPHQAIALETRPVFNPHDVIMNTAIPNPTTTSDLW
jgi:hypothetical protein